MSLDFAKLGSTFTVDATFLNFDGTPFVPKAPATYLVKDFNGDVVISGTAAQDGLYSELWHATIALPKSAPYSNSRKYSISWQLVGGPTGNNICSVQENFNVLPPDDYALPEDLDTFENELVIVPGDEITDCIYLPPTIQPQNITIKVLDDQGNLYFSDTVTNVEPLDVAGSNMYGLIIDPIATLTVGFRPYIVQWSYLSNGRTVKQYHFMYVVNYRIITLMDQLRQLVDKAKFDHPNPNLRYNDVDLVAALFKGCMIVNYTVPMTTSFHLLNFPRQLDYFLIYAAAYELLSSQYLAEGVSAVEFSGQSVNLTIDRQSSIDTALQRITDVVRTELPKAKTLIAKESVTGVLAITPSPSLNPLYFGATMMNGWDQSYVGDVATRLGFYADTIGNLNSLGF